VPLDPLPDWVHPRQQEIGVRIRAIRRDVGLTQEQLAERVGCDRKTIIRWENAYSVPDLIDLLLLAYALDVELAALVG
jgi:transcriptional regulator with XRE-family HTH domain